MTVESESNAEIKPKSKRGGVRKGAGRKPDPARALLSEARAVAIEGESPEALDAALKAVAPRCVANLVKLANGGFEQGEEKWSVYDHDGTLRAEPVLVERGQQVDVVLVPRQHLPVVGRRDRPEHGHVTPGSG